MDKEALQFAKRHHLVDSLGANFVMGLGMCVGLVNLTNWTWLPLACLYMLVWAALNVHYFQRNYRFFIEDRLCCGQPTTLFDFDANITCKRAALKEAWRYGMKKYSWIKVIASFALVLIASYAPETDFKGWFMIIAGSAVLAWILLPFYYAYLNTYHTCMDDAIREQFKEVKSK